MYKSKWISLLICGIGLSLAGCDVVGTTPEPVPTPMPVESPGVRAEANLVPAEDMVLSFAIAGRVGEVLVEEGDVVLTGDPLARLDDTQPLDAQVVSAERAVLQAQQNLEDLRENADLVSAQARAALVRSRQERVEAERAWDAVDNDDFRADLDDARIDMEKAEDELDDAEEDLADYQDLDEDHPTREAAEDDLEQAQQAYAEAVWALEDLQNRYDLAAAQLRLAEEALTDAERRSQETEEGPHPDDLALAEASLSEAQAQLAAAQAAREEATLVAPFDGRVLRMELQVGQLVSPVSTALVLADTSQWYLETNDLTEDEVVWINPDEPVSIHFDALPGKTFSGEVESISEYFVEQFGDITYVVRIRLLDSEESLRWGMTAEVAFAE